MNLLWFDMRLSFGDIVIWRGMRLIDENEVYKEKKLVNCEAAVMDKAQVLAPFKVLSQVCNFTSIASWMYSVCHLIMG